MWAEFSINYICNQQLKCHKHATGSWLCYKYTVRMMKTRRTNYNFVFEDTQMTSIHIPQLDVVEICMIILYQVPSC